MKIDFLAEHPQLISTLARLLHEEWGDLKPWSNVSRVEARIAASAQRNGVPATFVAVADDGSLIGSASLKFLELPAHPDKQYWLGEVFVRKEYRRKGIGSKLISACIRYAGSIGISVLYLYTPDQATLYQQYGWEPIETDVVNGEDVKVMRLCLTSEVPLSSGTRRLRD